MLYITICFALVLHSFLFGLSYFLIYSGLILLFNNNRVLPKGVKISIVTAIFTLVFILETILGIDINFYIIKNWVKLYGLPVLLYIILFAI